MHFLNFKICKMTDDWLLLIICKTIIYSLVQIGWSEMQTVLQFYNFCSVWHNVNLNLYFLSQKSQIITYHFFIDFGDWVNYVDLGLRL